MMGLQHDWGKFWIYTLDMVLVTNTGVAFLLFVGTVRLVELLVCRCLRLFTLCCHAWHHTPAFRRCVASAD